MRDLTTILVGGQGEEGMTDEEVARARKKLKIESVRSS